MIKKIKHLYHYLRSFVYLISNIHKQDRQSKAKHNVLIINHFFDQDIEALLMANEEEDFVFKIVEPRKMFAPIISLFPKSIRIAEIPYDDDSVEIERQKSRKLSELIFNFVHKRFPFECIITPSDLFYWLREFIDVADKMGIPTIVIDKEGTISPYYFKNHTENIKKLFPPIGDKFIVWSENKRDFWINTGVKKEEIEIVGQLRSDLLKTLKKKKLNLFTDEKNKPLIVFFTYMLDAYIPKKFYHEEHFSWKELRNESHDILKKIAIKYENINFVIKCHPQQLDIESIKREFQSFKNVKVLAGASISNQLLMNADLVLGFQTTALIEAVALEKPTIYTFFSKSVEKFQDGILPFHEYDAFRVARSKEELNAMIEDFIEKDFKNEMNKESRERLLKKYLNNPDGNVGKRVLRFLENYLEEHNVLK